jgi:hypothetical protein
MESDFINYNGIILCRKTHRTTPEERLIVSLSNGETIFEDRLDKEKEAGIDAIFWKRLKKYVETNKEGVKISNIRFQHRDGIIELFKNAKAYYYIKRQFGDIGNSMLETFRVGSSKDMAIIEGIEVGYGRIVPFSIDFSRGGFGVIVN